MINHTTLESPAEVHIPDTSQVGWDVANQFSTTSLPHSSVLYLGQEVQQMPGHDYHWVPCSPVHVQGNDIPFIDGRISSGIQATPEDQNACPGEFQTSDKGKIFQIAYSSSHKSCVFPFPPTKRPKNFALETHPIMFCAIFGYKTSHSPPLPRGGSSVQITSGNQWQLSQPHACSPFLRYRPGYVCHPKPNEHREHAVCDGHLGVPCLSIQACPVYIPTWDNGKGRHVVFLAMPVLPNHVGITVKPFPVVTLFTTCSIFPGIQATPDDHNACPVENKGGKGRSMQEVLSTTKLCIYADTTVNSVKHSINEISLIFSSAVTLSEVGPKPYKFRGLRCQLTSGIQVPHLQLHVCAWPTPRSGPGHVCQLYREHPDHVAVGLRPFQVFCFRIHASAATRTLNKGNTIPVGVYASSDQVCHTYTTAEAVSHAFHESFLISDCVDFRRINAHLQFFLPWGPHCRLPCCGHRSQLFDCHVCNYPSQNQSLPGCIKNCPGDGWGTRAVGARTLMFPCSSISCEACTFRDMHHPWLPSPTQFPTPDQGLLKFQRQGVGRSHTRHNHGQPAAITQLQLNAVVKCKYASFRGPRPFPAISTANRGYRAQFLWPSYPCKCQKLGSCPLFHLNHSQTIICDFTGHACTPSSQFEIHAIPEHHNACGFLSEDVTGFPKWSASGSFLSHLASVSNIQSLGENMYIHFRFLCQTIVQQAWLCHCSGMQATPAYRNACHSALYTRKPLDHAQAQNTISKVKSITSGQQVDHHFDAISLLAAGARQRAVPQQPAIHTMPTIARQEDDQADEDEDPVSDDDMSSVSDPIWQDSIAFALHYPAIELPLHAVNDQIRYRWLARNWQIPVQQIAMDYPMPVRPQDLVDQQLHARLVKMHSDPLARHHGKLTLTDIEIHPPAPERQFRLIRQPRYIPALFRPQALLRALFLWDYCQYASLPCLMSLNGVGLSLDLNALQPVENGDFLRIALPPPNAEHAQYSTQCVLSAVHHGIPAEGFEFYDLLAEAPQLEVTPNPNPVIDDPAISLLQVRFRRRIPSQYELPSGQHVDQTRAPEPRNARNTSPSWKATWRYAHKFFCTPARQFAPATARVGEAKVPGPPKHVDTPTWAIGAINPTGLAGKAILFNDLTEGIYAISESHLPTRGRVRFSQELSFAKSKFQYTAGPDAPLKVNNVRSVGGKHTGVGFLSSFPCRPLLQGWKPELYATARLHAATFQINNTCIAAGVCYGFAQAPDTRATQTMTDQLLSELTNQIVLGFPGHAVIAGDFNQHPGMLHEVSRWEAKGWKDLQDWANEHFGILPGPTCQQASRKDYVFLSPSLQQYLVSCQNTFDKFPDHSVLVGLLRAPSSPEPIPRWPKPQPIDYTTISSQQIAAVDCSPAEHQSSPTEQYAAICQRFEAHVNQVRLASKQPPLRTQQRGRGQTLARTMSTTPSVALKPGRAGDIQPAVNSWSLLHCRWITQARRLDHYVKAIRKNTQTPAASIHRAALWRSVIEAAGFSGSFARWWNSQALHAPHLLPWFPFQPPDLAIAEHIRDTFHISLRAYEKELIASRVSQAKQSRLQDVNRVYRDVRKPQPVPVQMLVAKSTATVIEVVDEGSVIVDNTDQLLQAEVLECRTGPLHIIHIEEGQIWFTTPHQLVPGDVIAEVHMKGQIHDIHQAFLDEWTKRWDRHRDLDPSQWDDILALTESLLECPQMPLQPLTLERWKAAIRSKKVRAATGTDGMTRSDLLAFPDALHQQLLDLLHTAERTGQWPQQLLQGSVHSLEKIPGAQTVAEYRPITVMPLVYRLYTTLRSREILQHLQHHVSPTLLGNIPGRHAQTLWWSMQHRIEVALQTGMPLNGATSDLIKAFNHLPREVTFKVAVCMGVHPNIVRAWAGATVHLQRHFVVRNSPSASVASTTGFVEGCGLSVCAMVLINSLIHAYMEQRHPQVTFTSYVDNFELESHAVEHTTQALESLRGFCQLLDMHLDDKKTFRWACTAGGRQEIRDLALQPLDYARDLGAHLQFNARQTNATTTSKFKQLGTLWHQLSRSQAPYEQKLRVLRTVAWPRCMYGVATVHIGPSHFIDARAGAFNALGCTKAGANPQIHFLTTSAITDPEFYALWHTVVQFRRQMPQDLCDPTLSHAAARSARKRKPGPGGVLISRLEQLCWTYQRDGTFLDGEDASIHIFDTPIQELKYRLTRAWQHMVGRQWEHRMGFSGLRYVCTHLSKPSLTFTPDEQGLLRVAQNGTFYTHDTLVHSGKVPDALCKYCGLHDSVYHRHWECVSTLSSRSRIPVELLQQILQSPACLTQHCWAPEPSAVRDFRSHLNNIPDTTQHFLPIGPQRQHYDFFCDGSGKNPTQPLARVVGWGVVLAGAHPPASSPTTCMGRCPRSMADSAESRASSIRQCPHCRDPL